MPTVTVGGLPGTGTSTLCRLLQESLGLPYTYAGQLFRDAAAAKGLSLAEFGKLCETDPSVDQELDNQQVELLRGEPLILEGRLAGWMANRNELPAVKIWVICEESERVRRVVERDGGSLDEQMAKMAEREASEAKRYNEYYGIDLSDTSIYDLILDSTVTSAEELAQVVTATIGSG